MTSHETRLERDRTDDREVARPVDHATRAAAGDPVPWLPYDPKRLDEYTLPSERVRRRRVGATIGLVDPDDRRRAIYCAAFGLCPDCGDFLQLLRIMYAHLFETPRVRVRKL